jgi:hypothetical protein
LLLLLLLAPPLPPLLPLLLAASAASSFTNGHSCEQQQQQQLRSSDTGEGSWMLCSSAPSTTGSPHPAPLCHNVPSNTHPHLLHEALERQPVFGHPPLSHVQQRSSHLVTRHAALVLWQQQQQQQEEEEEEEEEEAARGTEGQQRQED